MIGRLVLRGGSRASRSKIHCFDESVATVISYADRSVVTLDRGLPEPEETASDRHASARPVGLLGALGRIKDMLHDPEDQHDHLECFPIVVVLAEPRVLATEESHVLRRHAPKTFVGFYVPCLHL